ncbi:hypothetical protein B296_00012990 [Ensete ventricosum]|uniref:Uncharacterized protein n=1 Tax=Ensete ventricosum TaxID=4639 RepID=A0A427AI74_ENSVE|nr:hypothetical protein B296_00012990 [Ensete ventricosum]
MEPTPFSTSRRKADDEGGAAVLYHLLIVPELAPASGSVAEKKSVVGVMIQAFSKSLSLQCKDIPEKRTEQAPEEAAADSDSFSLCALVDVGDVELQRLCLLSYHEDRLRRTTAFAASSQPEEKSRKYIHIEETERERESYVKQAYDIHRGMDQVRNDTVFGIDRSTGRRLRRNILGHKEHLWVTTSRWRALCDTWS